MNCLNKYCTNSVDEEKELDYKELQGTKFLYCESCRYMIGLGYGIAKGFIALDHSDIACEHKYDRMKKRSEVNELNEYHHPLTISECITALERVKFEYGDIELYIFDENEPHDIPLTGDNVHAGQIHNGYLPTKSGLCIHDTNELLEQKDKTDDDLIQPFVLF